MKPLRKNLLLKSYFMIFFSIITDPQNMKKKNNKQQLKLNNYKSV